MVVKQQLQLARQMQSGNHCMPGRNPAYNQQVVHANKAQSAANTRCMHVHDAHMTTAELAQQTSKVVALLTEL